MGKFRLVTSPATLDGVAVKVVVSVKTPLFWKREGGRERERDFVSTVQTY